MISTQRRPRRRRRGVPGGSVLRGLAFLGVFAVGIAVGSALDDNPDPSETRTHVRTLEPRLLGPAQTTVTTTITVSTG